MKFLSSTLIALVALLTMASAALAEDYVVPITIGTETMTVTITVEDGEVMTATVYSDLPFVMTVGEVAKTRHTIASVPRTEAKSNDKESDIAETNYEAMIRGYRTMKGSVVRVSGTVISPEQADGPVARFIAISDIPGELGDDDTSIYIKYDGDNVVLENDRIEVVGVLDGIHKDAYGSHPIIVARSLVIGNDGSGIRELCLSGEDGYIPAKPMDISHNIFECTGKKFVLSGVIKESDPESGRLVVKTKDYGYYVHSDEAIIQYNGDDWFVDGDSVSVYGKFEGIYATANYLGGQFSIRPVIVSSEIVIEGN